MLFHYLKVYTLILFRKHGCSTLSILSAYTKLIINAHFLDRREKPSASPRMTVLFRKQVLFHSYIFLVNQFEEIFVLDCYRSQLRTNKKVIIDGGGHLGMAVLYFTTVYPTAKIVSFEPDPSSFKLLHQFITLNGLHQVTIVNAALAHTSGKISFHTYSETSGKLDAGLYNTQSASVSIEVPAVTLSDYLSEPVDLLKLDIEGAEVGVIQELINSHKISQVREIVMEFHPRINNNSASLIDQLKESGFEVQAFDSSVLYESTSDYLLRFYRTT